VRFFPSDDGLPDDECWLLIARNVLTGEVKYFLSNAPKDTPAEVLLHVAFSRWHVERLFEDAKGQLGMDQFEVRGYVAVMRHLILTMASLLFLVEQAQHNSAWTICQVRLAVEVQLDEAITERERTRRLEKAWHIIQYRQERNELAERSHRRRRLRQLRDRGILISRLRKCFHVF